jgi:hypothetical protein
MAQLESGTETALQQTTHPSITGALPANTFLDSVSTSNSLSYVVCNFRRLVQEQTIVETKI